MKKGNLILFSLVIITFYSCGGAKKRDVISNQISYPEVRIGNQIWMTQNLNVDNFCNGDPIPEAKTNEEWQKALDNESPAWCYYENDPINGTKYGKLYNWYAVIDNRQVAPIGWHIPSDNDWIELADFLGETVGNKMKSNKEWDGSNESGFSGLPAGSRFDDKFKHIGKNAGWWTYTKNSDNKYTFRYLYYDSPYFNWFGGGALSGISIRCIKN